MPGEKEPRGGLNEAQAKAMAEAIEVLKKEGAVIVDPADIPSVVDTDAANNFLAWGTCSGTDGAKGKDANCSVVLKYGMKRDFNAWLDTLEDSGPVSTLAELRAWNLAHQSRGAIKYGQANLDVSDEIAAKPGYPTVIVPFAMVPNAPTPAFPEGFEAKPIPYGVSFTGMACSEPRLIEIAYAFEQATKKRTPPASAP